MARIAVNINPKILEWAREESGYNYDEISAKLNISNERYISWEKTGNEIPFGKLKEIANSYKRQIATFFLPEVPPKQNLPKDYRNLDFIKSKLSKDVLHVVRKVNKFRETAIVLRTENFWEKQYDWINEIKELVSKNKLESDEIAFWLREKLGISIDSQFKFRSASDAYRIWRNAIEEKLGILVFQFSMPFNEVQGFCYADYFPYAIVVNSKHTYTGRIFTLFHELAHLLLQQSGICIPDNVEENQEFEYTCNLFAGNFLVPKSNLVKASNLHDITKFSNKLSVSREVYLRRLLEQNYINKTLFFTLLDDIKESYNKIPKKKDGFAMPEVRSKAERGATYYGLVIESLNSNQINYSTASELLGLNFTRMLSEI